MKRKYLFLSMMFMIPLCSCAQKEKDIKGLDIKPLYKFSINMFDELQKKKNKSSFVCSPFGVASLYRILGDGADGKTKKDIDDVIGINSQDMAILYKFIFSKNKLKSYDEYYSDWFGTPEKDSASYKSYVIQNNNAFQIHSFNQIVLNEKYNLKDDYKQSIENNYLTQVDRMDLSDKNSIIKINDWCSKKTQGMIPSVIKDIDPMTLLVALNSIYIKGNWEDQFDEKHTKKEKFKLLSGNTSVF